MYTDSSISFVAMPDNKKNDKALEIWNKLTPSQRYHMVMVHVDRTMSINRVYRACLAYVADNIEQFERI